jgi:hypothetical protein
MSGLVEWQFSDSAEVQLYEQKEHAGHNMLTLDVLPLEPERKRLQEGGLRPGPIDQTNGYFISAQTIPTKTRSFSPVPTSIKLRRCGSADLRLSWQDF